jgi:hypothetical protein
MPKKLFSLMKRELIKKLFPDIGSVLLFIMMIIGIILIILVFAGVLR